VNFLGLHNDGTLAPGITGESRPLAARADIPPKARRGDNDGRFPAR
jgi:hypothetical protein